MVQFLSNYNKKFALCCIFVLCSGSDFCLNEKQNIEIEFRHSQICRLTDCTFIKQTIICPLTNNLSFGQFLRLDKVV